MPGGLLHPYACPQCIQTLRSRRNKRWSAAATNRSFPPNSRRWTNGARSGELEAEEVVRRAPVRPRDPRHHAAGEPRARALTPRPRDRVIVWKSLLSDISKRVDSEAARASRCPYVGRGTAGRGVRRQHTKDAPSGTLDGVRRPRARSEHHLKHENKEHRNQERTHVNWHCFRCRSRASPLRRGNESSYIVVRACSARERLVAPSQHSTAQSAHPPRSLLFDANCRTARERRIGIPPTLYRRKAGAQADLFAQTAWLERPSVEEVEPSTKVEFIERIGESAARPWAAESRRCHARARNFTFQHTIK